MCNLYNKEQHLIEHCYCANFTAFYCVKRHMQLQFIPGTLWGFVNSKSPFKIAVLQEMYVHRSGSLKVKVFSSIFLLHLGIFQSFSQA